MRLNQSTIKNAAQKQAEKMAEQVLVELGLTPDLYKGKELPRVCTPIEEIKVQPLVKVDSSGLWVKPEWFDTAVMFVKEGVPVMLSGPASVGKTTAFRKIADALGRKLFLISCHKYTDQAELVGTMGLKDGKTIWAYGAVPLSLMHNGPALLVLDEFNQVGDPNALTMLNNLLDGTRSLYIPQTGEKFPARPDWGFMGGYNPDYTGTVEQNEALAKSRPVVLECPHFSDEMVTDVLHRAFPQSPLERIKACIRMGKVVQASREKGETMFDFCFRTLCQMLVYWHHLGVDDGNAGLKTWDTIVAPKVGSPMLLGGVRDGMRRTVELDMAEYRPGVPITPSSSDASADGDSGAVNSTSTVTNP